MVRSALLLAAAAAVAVTSVTAQTEIDSAEEDYSFSATTYSQKKSVDPKKLASKIKVSALKKKGKELEKAAYSTPARNRVFASPGHENTLLFIEKYLQKVKNYWTWERQPFEALYANANGNFSASGVEYKPTIFQYSPSTTGTGVTANLVPVANLGCNKTDYPSAVSGQIALISRGSCEFGLKSALAGAAGAVGAVLYNNVPGPIGGGTLGTPGRAEGPYVPSVGVSAENGTILLTAINGGQTVSGLLQVFSIIENRTTYNIIAQTKNGDPNNVLMIGAHSDSVEAGPGINDDGSGTIGILETALQLSDYSTKSAVRLGFWSAEEFGLLGSEHYVTTLPAAEKDKIKLYLNFDMIASPNYVYGIYDGDGSAFNISGPPGSDLAEHYFADWFKSQGLPSSETAFTGRSDYGPFLDANIAAGGLFTGAEVLKTPAEAAIFGGQAGVAYDVNYHQAGDNYTNLNFEAFLENTKAVAASTAYWSSNLDKIPKRNATSPVVRRSAVHRHPHVRSTAVQHAHALHDCGKAPKVWS